MVLSNPFRPTRFEHHQHPLIWISPNVRHLEGLKSVYVGGTRGSGKTSLLKAVNWRERLYNPTVEAQLGADAPDFVAVYFRLPDYLTSAVGLIDWRAAFPQSPTPEIVGYGIFCHLIEFVAAQLLCEAIASLRAARRFIYSVADEEKAVASLFRLHPKLASPAEAPCRDLDALSMLFRARHQRMNIAITRGLVGAIAEGLPDALPGAVINDLATMLRSLACSHEGVCSPNFHLKISIDDCETLKPLQQRFLNSLVRSAKHPLFWIVSFVSGDYDTTNTLVYNQTLSDADRSQIYLDNMSKEEFFQLCEEVSLLRIYYSDEEAVKAKPLKTLRKRFFRLDDVLGQLDVNAAIQTAARDSLSAELTSLIERSRADDDNAKEAPPIYETYVLEKLGDRLTDDRLPNKRAYMRRKQVAALLAIFSEFRLKKIPYVGARTIVSLSDRCIRDFLELMGSVFDIAVARREVSSVSDMQFREKPISIDAQREGVWKSSQAKLDGITNAMEHHWQEATRAVEFIGKLTARLQANHTSLSTLATPERGNFIFDLGRIETDRAAPEEVRPFLATLLRRCEADGLLKAPPSVNLLAGGVEGVDFAFHLHLRFAPHFGFSYRGPYGSLRMPMAEFVEACIGDGEATVDELVDQAYAKINKDDADEHPRLL